MNLNGDQANVFVLRRRLEWLGIESKVVSIAPEDFEAAAARIIEAPESKFLMVGHGSKAAVTSFANHHEAIRQGVLDFAQAGGVGLVVGSGYELVCPDFERTPRLSDYADLPAEDGLPRVFGYINTDTNLPAISRLGDSVIATMVHGPVLARTPELADLLLTSLGVLVAPNANSVEADKYAEGARSH